MDIIKDKIKLKEMIQDIRKEIVIEQSYIIPDIKKDIVKNIISNGNIFIEKVEIQANRIKIDGKAIIFNMYLNSDEENSMLDVMLPFSEILDINKINVEEKIDYKSEININKIEVKILNERKVNIIVKTDVNIKLYKENEVEIIKEIKEKDNQIQKLEKKIELNSIIGSGKNKATLKESLKVSDVEKMESILKLKYDIQNIESKISYNKVLAKADINMEILYKTEESKINKYNINLPLMSFIDIQNVTDSNISKLQIDICNLEYEIVSNNTINILMEFNINCDVYEVKQVNLLEDIYGIKNTYKYDRKKIKIENNSIEKMLTKNINEKVLVDNINQLFYSNANTSILKKEKINGLNKFVGNCEVTYLYSTFDNKYIDSMSVNFEFEFETLEKYENISLKIANSNFIILPDSSIDNKIEIDIYSGQNEYININMIDNIEEIDENFNSYSLVIYFVQNGDTLWKIAKKFRSTVDQIAKINNIEDENKIDVGQKLYIPKAV